MSRVALGSLLAALLFVAACDSGGENGGANISGQWSGTVEHAGTEYTVGLTLQQLQGGQQEDIIQGEGEVRSAEETFTFTVENGTFHPPSNEVTFPQQYHSGRPGQMQGRVADDVETMTVAITGGPVGFNGEEFTMDNLDR